MEKNRKPCLIVLFGKDGCPHCSRLKKDVTEIILEKEFREKFDLDYQNLSTLEGMIAYAGAETVNGQRIPALQLMRFDNEKNSYMKIPDKRSEYFDEERGRLFVPVYLQLETDYSSGGGSILKDDVRKLLAMAD